MTRFPLLPKNLAQVEESFPEWLSRTHDEQPFLIHKGAIKRGSRVWAYTFASPSGLDHLLRSEKATFDGTFKACPFPFAQIFIANVVTTDMRSLPVLWALLTHKSIEAYKCGVFKPLRRKLLAIVRAQESLANQGRL